MICDFRGDLLSRLPPTSLEMMVSAAHGARAFGHREDKFQEQLERKVSDLCGFEDALFVPTCTVANQITIRIRCSPGESVLAASDSHLATIEGQSTTALTGALVEALDGERGHLTPAGVLSRLKAPRDDGTRRTTLVWLENTHMRAGGTLMPQGDQKKISDHCASVGVAIHLDGSRLWNAAVAQGVPLSQVSDGVQSIALSLNKALGAPVGSVLVGSAEFIREAVRVRQVYGAAWMPIGILAAAALGALENFSERLDTDNRRARCFLATYLASICSESKWRSLTRT